jgi:tRNA threonylcarbamoyladenosine biosynthesis protein TsaE
MTLNLKSNDSVATEKIGKSLGERLRGGEVIELISDLGGGKTTFVRGLAAGMGSTDKVASPTFTVSKEYVHKKLRMAHYDFYRLNDPGLMQFELAETLSDPSSITVVEWADIVHDVLPKERITITISNTGETERNLHIVIPDEFAYLWPK